MDRRWILGGVLFAGGIGLVRALTYRPKFDDDSRIMVIGDSFARGMAPHFKALAESEGLPFIAGAIDGTRLDQWVASPWLIENLKAFQPTHVLVSLGGNDSYTFFTPEQVGDRAARLVALLEDAGAHVIWIGVPPMPPRRDGKPFNEETILAVEAEAPYYFDSSVLDIPRAPDGLHPTAAGYAGWAGTVWQWLT